jgi:hypothetical protein
MSIRITDSLSFTIDMESKKAYVARALSLAEHEGSLRHASSINALIAREFPNLKMSYDETRDTLYELVKEKAVIRETSESDDPIYRSNPDFVKRASKS